MDTSLGLAAGPSAWAALATLIAMEVVLGLDNLVFIALPSNRIDEARRRGSARRLGLSLALVFRLALLAAASWAARLTGPLATVFEPAFCAHDLRYWPEATSWHPRAPAVRTRARRHGDPAEPLGAGCAQLRRPRSSGEAPSPVVDAAPPDAIVGIAAQAIGPVNVVRIVLIGVRASEHCRQLARGKLQGCPQRHDRNVLVFCADRNGSRQRTRQRGRKR
jgi:hypothetical protein